MRTLVDASAPTTASAGDTSKDNMQPTGRIRRACGFLCAKYAEQYAVLNTNLSRFTGLLIMLNVTLFFVGGAVIHEGY